MKSCKDKQRLYNIWKRNPNDDVAESDYKKYSTLLNKLLNNAKNIFEKQKISQYSTKDIWQYVNNKLNKRQNNKNMNIDFLINDGKRVTDTKEIANNFNNFYSVIGKRLASKINKSKHSYNLKLPSRNTKSIFLKPTNYFEIKSIINSLKNKSGGIDHIHVNILKFMSDFITEPIVYIINLSMSKSVFPEHYKIAEVVPVFKTGKKFDTTNYRPISLISNFAKIFEKVLYLRLNDFFTKSNIIVNNQFGFVKDKGTKDAIAEITNLIYKKVDAGLYTSAVFLDFSKAFDTVNHNILFDKLEMYGIRVSTLKLIKSYFESRKQYVRIIDVCSNVENIEIGVPQGTILGPLFFIVYINDMLSLLPNIISYADDTVILCAQKSWCKTQEVMQESINILNHWLSINYLSLNAQKTVYITFSINNKKLPINFELKIEDCKLKNVKSCKYLGIYIDQHLLWNVHIENLVKKLRYLLFVFHRLKYIMSKKVLVSIYYGIFHSIASYGIIAWGNAYKNTIVNLYNLQARVLKILGSDNLENKPLTLKQNFYYESLIGNYKLLRETYVNSNIETRNKGIILYKCNNEFGKKNFNFTAISVFKKLPIHLKKLSGMHSSIHKKLKKWIQNNY